MTGSPFRESRPRYFVLYSGQVTGPHDEGTIRKGVSDGHLTRMSLVGRSEQGPFLELQKFKELWDVFPPPTDAEVDAEVRAEVALAKRAAVSPLNPFFVRIGLVMAGVVALLIGREERSVGAYGVGLLLFLASFIVKLACAR